MKPSQLQTVRRLIWLYFWLLIFEGVLRKWVLPGLAGPLLLIRAPVVLALYGYVMSVGKFPTNNWVTSLTVLGVISMLAGFVAFPENPLVSAYGWQANFLHLPLMFVMAKFLSIEDVRKFGRWILLPALPMAALMVLQFRSGSGAWVNRGAGEGSLQIGVGGGRIRPAGTFSYNLGVAYLFSLITAFVLFQALTRRFSSKLVTAAAGFAILVAAATCGSRNFLALVSLVVASLFVVLIVRPQMAAGIIRVAAAGAVAIVIAGSLSFVKEGMAVMERRIQHASKNEGGFTGFAARFGNAFTKPGENMLDIPILGRGLGLGTNGGAQLVRGSRGFMLAEGEWERVILESGPLLGSLYILWRIALLCWLGVLSLRAAKAGNVLPLLLFAAVAVILVMGQFGQPTVVGFAAFSSGLCLASMRSSPDSDEEDQDADDEQESSEELLEREEPMAASSRRDRMEW
jgi:hypothetical protein